MNSKDDRANHVVAECPWCFEFFPNKQVLIDHRDKIHTSKPTLADVVEGTVIGTLNGMDVVAKPDTDTKYEDFNRWLYSYTLGDERLGLPNDQYTFPNGETVRFADRNRLFELFTAYRDKVVFKDGTKLPASAATHPSIPSGNSLREHIWTMLSDTYGGRIMHDSEKELLDKIEALLAIEIQKARVEALESIFGMRPIIGIDRPPSSDLAELVDSIKDAIGALKEGKSV